MFVAKIKCMSVYGNMLKKNRVGRSGKYFSSFILFGSNVKCKNVPYLSYIIVALKVNISSHYA